MGDSFIDLVEQRLQTSLSLDLSPRSTPKSSLPFTILNLDGSPVLHLFGIPAEKSIFGSSPGEKPKFGVVTLNGCITVYDTMFRKVTWKKQTTLEKVSWGTLSWRKSAASPNPSIMVHSRQKGFHQVKVEAKSGSPSPGSGGGDPIPPHVNELLSSETHIGFCKPYLCTDQAVIVPIGSSGIGIHMQDDDQSSTSVIRPCFKFSSAILSLMELGNNVDGSSKYVMVTTEDGKLSVVSCSLKGKSSKLVTTLTLTCSSTPSREEAPIGTCMEGDGSTFVIGTNLRRMFLYKCDFPLEDDLQMSLVGKKILPTEGVSCLAMREGNTILGVGCFDGTIRIFGFPEMNQISAIQFHKSQINSLLFLNEKVDKRGKWYLVCGAADGGGLSVWSIPQSRGL